MIRPFKACILALALSASAAADTKLLTHSVGDAGVRDEAGQLVGKPGSGRRAFLLELVRAMARDMGNSQSVEEVPFLRGMMLARNGEGYAFFNALKTPDRLPNYKWVGPLYASANYFYDREDRPSGIKTLDDARKVDGVCAVHGTNMVGWLRQHGFDNVVIANSFEACLQLMSYGRVALVQNAEHPEVLTTRFKAQGLHLTGVATRVPGEDSTSEEGFLLFSMSTPDDRIAAWQAALDAIKASGEYDRLVETYLIPDEASESSAEGQP